MVHSNILSTRLDFLVPAHCSGKLLRMLEIWAAVVECGASRKMRGIN